MSDIPRSIPVDAQQFQMQPTADRPRSRAREAFGEVGQAITTVVVTGLALRELSKTMFLASKDQQGAKTGAKSGHRGRTVDKDLSKTGEGSKGTGDVDATLKFLREQNPHKQSTTKSTKPGSK